MLSFIKSIFNRKKSPQNSGVPAIKNVPKLESPILLLMDSPGMASVLENVPSWKVVRVTSENECVEKIQNDSFGMFIALSPINQSGLAGKMISLFKNRNPNALTVYHGWSYNLEVTLPRALKCQADIAMVGGITSHNLIHLLGTAIINKSRFVIEPSIEYYAAILKLTCSESPFWNNQNIPCPANDVE